MKRILLVVSLVALLLFGTILGAAAAGNGRSELVQMRTEFTKVFKNDDGTITRQYWVNPIHYLNEDYQWEPIDKTIVDLTKDKEAKAKFDKDFAKELKRIAKEEGATAEQYNKGITKHLFKMYFPKKLNQSLHVKYEDFLLSMKPLNILHTNQQKIDVKALRPSNEVVYTDVWHHTDLKYEITNTGLREYITLNDLDAEREFSFFIKAKNFELETLPTGEIAAYSKKDGEMVFVIPRPVMWDAANVYNHEIEYQLTAEKGGYRLALKYDENYVNAPERVFPVTIDPDIVLSRNYVDEMTYISTQDPSDNFYTAGRMEMGNYKDWNILWLGYSWEKKRGLFRFNRLTSDLGAVSDQVDVIQAKLYLDVSENDTESTFADVWHINYNATDWEVTQVTWNSPWGSGGNSVLPSYEDTWVYIVKGESAPRTYTCYLDNTTVETWIHSNETLNRGLMLKDYYEDTKTNTLKKFSNAALELTLNEEIFIEASASVYPYTPQTISFSANASSAKCGTISNYSWDFDINDGVNDRDTRKYPKYAYQTAGEHTYSVTATDINGHSRTYYGTVYVPEETFTAYYGTTDPQTLRFVPKTNYNCTYTWNFGDGGTYTGTQGYHKYLGEGTYNVTLTISNNYGVNPLVITKPLKYYQPIVYIHGFGDGFTCWDEMVPYLRDTVYAGEVDMKYVSAQDNLSGLPVHTAYSFDYYRPVASDPQFQNLGKIGTDGTVVSTESGNGTYGNQYNTLTYSYSEQLDQLIDNILTNTGFSKVNLVAHSMGGLVSRSYLKYQGGASKVDRLLTLGTPNHGIGDLESFVAKVIVKESWQRELEVREMGYQSDTFYSTSSPSTLLSYTELLNGDGQISINGNSITGCDLTDTVGPTRYATIAGRDNGHVSIPVVDKIWEWLAPDDGVIESGSVGLHGVNVDTNLQYPAIHSASVPGNKADEQILNATPFVASFINTWMIQDRLVNAVATKPAAWVEVEQYSDGTVKTFIVHTGATKNNAIWTWAMLQHQEDILDENGTDYYFSFKDYNSFWKDLSNETTSNEVLIDISPAHYVAGDTLRVTVVTYDTNGWKVEHLPVQL